MTVMLLEVIRIREGDLGTSGPVLGLGRQDADSLVILLVGVVEVSLWVVFVEPMKGRVKSIHPLLSPR